MITPSPPLPSLSPPPLGPLPSEIESKVAQAGLELLSDLEILILSPPPLKYQDHRYAFQTSRIYSQKSVCNVCLPESGLVCFLR